MMDEQERYPLRRQYSIPGCPDIHDRRDDGDFSRGFEPLEFMVNNIRCRDRPTWRIDAKHDRFDLLIL